MAELPAATILSGPDANPRDLDGLVVAVLGFGSQGRAHALNLSGSGIRVRVGLPSASRSREAALSEGLEVFEPIDAVRGSDVVAMLVPDELQADVYSQAVAPCLALGEGPRALLFAHGFAIHFGTVRPPDFVDILLVAPAAPGRALRSAYLEGRGVTGVLAVERDATGRGRRVALAYASAIGLLRAGVVETTFREETECDLFGEQVVVCGGLTALVTAAFETLVTKGYQPEIAYFECAQQLKLLADMVSDLGISGMRRGISGTARYGDLTRGPRVIGPASRAAMEEILSEVQSGAFAREWLLEHAAGRPRMRTLMAEAEARPIEEVGRRVRKLASRGEELLPAAGGEVTIIP
ncbi:MAG: ketol-acid reductoisomerase [Deltaproteobacteria bacterium]|nr:ketol-acid reductoisomerase [Deltaproteobacteria bacterium]